MNAFLADQVQGKILSKNIPEASFSPLQVRGCLEEKDRKGDNE